MTTMRSEIAEAAAVVRRTIARRDEVREIIGISGLAASPHILFAARGSSAHAARYAHTLLGSIGGPITNIANLDTLSVYGRYAYPPGAAIISLSQSGSAVDVAALVIHGRANGIRSIGITNEAESKLALEADECLLLDAGPEVAVPATKTYVAQLVVLAIICDELTGAGLENELLHIPDLLDEICDSADEALVSIDATLTANACFITGRGVNTPTALDAALKLKEAAAVLAEGMSTSDLLHGPIGAGTRATPILAYGAPGPSTPDIDQVLTVAVAADIPTVTVGRPHPLGGRSVFDLTDRVGEWLSPIPLGLIGLIAAERAARLRGVDPDQPRNLAKVTRTR